MRAKARLIELNPATFASKPVAGDKTLAKALASLHSPLTSPLAFRLSSAIPVFRRSMTFRSVLLGVLDKDKIQRQAANRLGWRLKRVLGNDQGEPVTMASQWASPEASRLHASITAPPLRRRQNFASAPYSGSPGSRFCLYPWRRYWIFPLRSGLLKSRYPAGSV